MTKEIRKFSSGATRDSEMGKNDYEGFISPIVIEAFGNYMTKHRMQSNGKLRDSDNWQKGFGLDVCIKSGWRHFLDWWLEHRGYKSRDGMIDALCGLMFNTMVYMKEYIEQNNTSKKKQ